MTFSIAARCTHSGQFGVAVSSSSPCVASRCAFTRAGVGAALSQNITDPRLGPSMLDLLESGLNARSALEQAIAEYPHSSWRQLLVVGVSGVPAIHTGAEALGICGQRVGTDCVAAGNLLASESVPEAMVDAFEASASEPLADRLMRALLAAAESGGEAGPVRSAGLQVADTVSWPVIDLRVDWSEDVLNDLQRLWQVYKPQVADYVTRALHPDASSAYGVPGDPK